MNANERKSKTLLMLFLAGASAFAQPPKPATSAAKPAAGKSALDKTALEAYLRHTELWLPQVGVLETEDMRRLNYLPVFFVATAVSMGGVLEATKALDVLTDLAFAFMQPLMTNIFTTTVVMYWTAFVYHFFLASEISMLGTSIPLVVSFAKAHGMSPLLLGMIWTFAAGGKLFVYQSGVLVVGYSYGFFAPRDLLRLGFALTVAEFLILLLLVPFYWPLLGIV